MKYLFWEDFINGLVKLDNNQYEKDIVAEFLKLCNEQVEITGRIEVDIIKLLKGIARNSDTVETIVNTKWEHTTEGEYVRAMIDFAERLYSFGIFSMLLFDEYGYSIPKESLSTTIQNAYLNNDKLGMYVINTDGAVETFNTYLIDYTLDLYRYSIELKDEVDEFNNQVDELNRDMGYQAVEFNDEKERADRLQDEVYNLEERVKELENENSQLESELEDIKAKLDEQ